MIRTMYDGITPSKLPAGGDLYAGYVDGKWPWAASSTELVHGRHPVRIAAHPSTNDGVIGDGPPDNGTWPQWVQWVVRRRAAGVDPTVYTNASSWSSGIKAFKDAGVPAPHWWIAHYDGDPTIPAGAVAKQYASNASYDTSSVADYWPGIDPAPATTPTTKQTEADVTTYFPIQVLPDGNGNDNAAGVATWPAGAAHVIQLIGDPGVWGDTSWQFRLAFNLTTGPDVITTDVAKVGANTEIQFASVKGLNPAICRGVTITRPDGNKRPWGGGAA